MARIVDEAGVEIHPESTRFGAELRGEVSEALREATAGQDRSVRIRVTTDADVAEAQIRRMLSNVQGRVDALTERIRAKTNDVLEKVDARLQTSLTKFRTRLTALRDQLRSRVLAPFLSWYRGELARVGRGWDAVTRAARAGATNIRTGWERDLARIRSGLASVRDVGERAFRSIADRAAPHLARLSAGIERLTRPFSVVRAYGIGTWRVVRSSGEAAFRRLRSAAEPALARIRSGIDGLGTRMVALGDRAGRVGRVITNSLGTAGTGIARYVRNINIAGTVTDEFGRKVRVAGLSVVDAAHDEALAVEEVGNAVRRHQDAAERLRIEENNVAAAMEAGGRATRALEDAEQKLERARSLGLGTAASLRELEDEASSAREKLALATTKYQKAERQRATVEREVARATSEGEEAVRGLERAQTRAAAATRRHTSLLGRLGRAARSAETDFAGVGSKVRDYGRNMERTGTLSRVASFATRAFGGGISALTGPLQLAGKGLDGLEDSLGGMVGGAQGAVTGLAQVATKSLLLAGVAGAVTYAIGAVGAGLSGLPGLAVGAGAALGTVALGMDGIKKAYNDGLKPALDKLKSQVSDVFQRQLTPVFKDLSTKLLPQITESMKTMAYAVSDTAQQFVDMVTKGENVNKINFIINRTASLIAGPFSDALANTGEQFLTLASNSTVLDAIGGIFTDLTKKTGDWFAEMDKSGLAARGMSALRDVLAKVEDLFFRVLTAATRFFADATPGVGRLIDSTGRYVDMVGGLGDAFGKAADGAGKLLDSIPQSTLDSIQQAFQHVGDALQRLGDNKAAQEMLKTLADEFGGLIDTVGKAIDLFNELSGVWDDIKYGAAKAEAGVVEFAGGSVPEIDRVTIAQHEAGQAAQDMGQKTQSGTDTAAGALGKLPPAADKAGQGITSGLTPPVNAIPGTVTDATGQVSFQPVLDAANRVFGALPKSVGDGINAAVASMDGGTRRIADSARTGFDQAAQAASDGGRRIADATRSGLDSAAAAAEAGGRRVSTAVRSGLDAAASAAEGGARRISTSVRTGLDAAAASAEAGARRVTSAVRTGMDQAASAAEKGGQRVRQALEQSLNASVKLSEDSWRRITQAFQQGGDRAAQIATDTGRKCVEAIRSQAGAMYQAGYTLISRLADGMIAAQGKATAAAARTAASIKAQFPSSPPKEGPLSGQGDPLVSGGKIVRRLASGIAAQAAAAPAALRPMLAKVAEMLDSLGLGSRPSLPAGTLTPIIGNLSKKMATVGATAAAKSDQKVRVDFGTVPNSVWDKLIKMGYRGDPNDGREALYVPRSVLNSLTHPGSSASRAPRQPQRRYEGRMTSMVRDAGPSTVRPRGAAEAQAAGGVDHDALSAAVAVGIETGIAKAMKPISATGLARINAKGEKDLARR